MIEKKDIETIDLEFKQEKPKDTPHIKRTYGDVGPSSLYGRVGDNMNYCDQGIRDFGFTIDRMWSWVWKDFFEALLSLFRLFLARNK